MKINHDKCCYCGGFAGVCPQNALELWETILAADNNCNECKIYVKLCPVGALKNEI